MKVLDANKLTDLAAALAAQGYRVIAPLNEGGVVRLAPWKPGRAIDTATVPVNSAKDFLLPRSEVIGAAKLEGNDFTLETVAPEGAKTALLCVRPCDAGSLAFLDALFNWDFQDIFYNARRAATTVITLGCVSADEHCFCTSVGLSPGATGGSDAMILPADGGARFILEPCTDKGRAVVAACGGLLRDAQAAPDPLADVPVRFNASDVTDWLGEGDNFDSPFWKEISLACLGCGACAYACPSCHCFDIQDEATRTEAQRLRNWDACGFALFTQHASGHNPRSVQSARWRQRVMHKFSYIPQRFKLLGCTGCGRCSRLCPNGMSMAEACERIDALCKSKQPK